MDEQVKQRAMIAFIVFNIAMFVYAMVFNNGFFSYNAEAITWAKVALSVLICGVLAGITFGILMALKKP